MGATRGHFNNVCWPSGGGSVTQLRSIPWEGATALYCDFRLQQHLDVCLDPQDELLLTFFLAGKVTGVTCDNQRRLDFQPDRALLRTPNRKGGYLIHVPGNCRNVFVQFRLKRHLMPQWLQALGVHLASRQVHRMVHLDNGTVLCNAALTARIRACLGRIQAQDAGHPAFVPLFHARAAELLTYVLLDLDELLSTDRSTAGPRQRLAEITHKARVLLDEAPGHAWSVAQLSAQAGCTEAQLQHGFRDVTGMSVHHYLRGVRLELAARLLRETHLSVQQIARECGWQCHGRFGSAFRGRYGVAPREFRLQSSAVADTASER
ncbi:MAG: AraC family transcriptional regulator [Burkholderiaceae bacterium]